jgi:hypothetical protein
MVWAIAVFDDMPGLPFFPAFVWRLFAVKALLSILSVSW